MAAHLNPFLNENDLIENAIETKSTASEKERSPDLIPEAETVSLDVVAAKLIRDSFLLTALELHTELVESGRELHRLRDFFSNPANFERTKQAEPSPPGNLHRTPSCQTFDSLDFARYSDDGDRLESDRVAVLEFELRKAQETIKSLRQSLTRTAECELSTPESATDGTGDFACNEPPRPLERRALNFLVNEYMLLNNYKLTSVTFCEENENQDFDDWDDVGLNLPKPASLIHLYREFSQHVTPSVQSQDFSCSVDLHSDDITDKLNDLDLVCDELRERLRVTEEQLQSTTAENKFLAQQLQTMERQVENAHLIKSSTPAVSPICTPSKKPDGQPPSDPRQTAGHPTAREWDEGVTPLHNGDELDAAEPNHRTEGRHRAEVGEGEKEGEDLGDSLDVLAGTDLPSQDVTGQSSQLSSPGSGGKNAENFQWHPSQRRMPATFQKALLDATFRVTQDNRIISEVTQITDSSGFRVVLMLARCLPHIVPNVLLARREELIPLILCAATLHPDSTQRDQLLNILFNLIKRPDKEQREMILTGCVAFAQHVGPSRAEAELLPQCWEQITHKYFERRLLVAEACGALTPYLPNEIRSSLVLSMLQQMLSEDKTEEVRAAVVCSLGVLTGFIDDTDKFKQVCQLMLGTLSDTSEKVVMAAHQVFLPSFAMWALELGRIESDIVSYFVQKLDNLVEVALASQVSSNSVTLPLDKVRFCQLLEMLRELIAPMFVSVLQAGPYVDQLSTTTGGADLTHFPPPSTPLLSLPVMLGGEGQLSRLLHLFEVYISEEWYEPWEALNWVAGDFVPQMLNLINTLDVLDPVIVHNLCGFFYDLCRTFGHTFTVTKVRSKFSVVLSMPDDQSGGQVASGQTALTKCTVPVYAAGILGAFGEEEDRSQLSGFLRDLLCTLSIHRAPLHSLSATLVQLAINPDYHELLLTVLWEGVVHPAADVRCNSAKMFELLVRGLNEMLIGTRVVPALITLASDPEISVRIATIPTLGTIMETATDRAILDKVHMQFQTFMDDPIYRDQHTVTLELIQMFARVAPNAEPKFREDFVLRRMAIVAASNNHASNIACRKEVAMQLFEAYSALSCCFISDQLISMALLPGLRCLLRDMEQVAPDHAAVVASMIREFESGNKGDANSHAERNNDVASSMPAAMGLPPDVSTEDMRAKMMSRFKDVKDRASQSRTNFSKIFGAKK